MLAPQLIAIAPTEESDDIQITLQSSFFVKDLVRGMPNKKKKKSIQYKIIWISSSSVIEVQ